MSYSDYQTTRGGELNARDGQGSRPGPAAMLAVPRVSRAGSIRPGQALL